MWMITRHRRNRGFMEYFERFDHLIGGHVVAVWTPDASNAHIYTDANEADEQCKWFEARFNSMYLVIDVPPNVTDIDTPEKAYERAMGIL